MCAQRRCFRRPSKSSPSKLSLGKTTQHQRHGQVAAHVYTPCRHGGHFHHLCLDFHRRRRAVLPSGGARRSVHSGATGSLRRAAPPISGGNADAPDCAARAMAARIFQWKPPPVLLLRVAAASRHPCTQSWTTTCRGGGGGGPQMKARWRCAARCVLMTCSPFWSCLRALNCDFRGASAAWSCTA
jgi:hypothetical protein